VSEVERATVPVAAAFGELSDLATTLHSNTLPFNHASNSSVRANSKLFLLVFECRYHWELLRSICNTHDVSTSGTSLDAWKSAGFAACDSDNGMAVLSHQMPHGDGC